MDSSALIVVAALVAVSTVLGFVWKSRQGAVSRSRVDAASVSLSPADVDSPRSFGARATLLQFSTDFCSTCPATRRVLGSVADRTDGVAHIDVDLTHRADLANRFGILQTPTTLVLDGGGRIVSRIGGPVRPTIITDELAALFAWGAVAGVARHPYGALFRRLVRPRLAAPAELEDPKPPTFAQGVGLVITAAGLLLALVGVPYALVIAAAAAFVAAFLNSVFGYCLGYQISLLLVRAGLLGRAARA